MYFVVRQPGCEFPSHHASRHILCLAQKMFVRILYRFGQSYGNRVLGNMVEKNVTNTWIASFVSFLACVCIIAVNCLQ